MPTQNTAPAALAAAAIPIGDDDHGRALLFRTDGDHPHMFICGPTGCGLSTAVRGVVTGAVIRGCDVRAYSTLPSDLPQLSGATVTYTPGGLADLVEETVADLQRRLESPLPGAHRPIVLAIDGLEQLLHVDVATRRRVLKHLDEIVYMGRAGRVSLLVATHLWNMFRPCTMDQFGTRVAVGHITRQEAIALFGDPAATQDGQAALPGRGTALTQNGVVAIQLLCPPALEPGHVGYYTLIAGVPAGAILPGCGPDGQFPQVTTDPRLIHPSQLPGHPNVETVVLGGGADGPYHLARLAPTGPVDIIDGNAICADGWTVEELQSPDRILGPQAHHLVDAVVAARQSLASPGNSDTAVRYVQAVNAAGQAHPGYPDAEAVIADALDLIGADGWWWALAGHGPEITALAARDLIGAFPGWNRATYDLLTGPWQAAFGVPIHPDDHNSASPADSEPEYVRTYRERWAAAVGNPDGSLDPDKVMRELHDYLALMESVSEVYDAITGGQLTKPDTAAEHVITFTRKTIRAGVAEALTNLDEDNDRFVVVPYPGDQQPEPQTEITVLYQGPAGSTLPVKIVFTQAEPSVSLQISQRTGPDLTIRGNRAAPGNPGISAWLIDPPRPDTSAT